MSDFSGLWRLGMKKTVTLIYMDGYDPPFYSVSSHTIEGLDYNKILTLLKEGHHIVLRPPRNKKETKGI